MGVGADVADGAAAAGGGGNPLQPVKGVADEQDAGAAGTADELVRTKEYGVVAVRLPRLHIYLHVRTAEQNQNKENEVDFIPWAAPNSWLQIEQ